MNLLPISGKAFEEYTGITCVLLREADSQCGVEDFSFSVADESVAY
jgi:hypothetical protein